MNSDRAPLAGAAAGVAVAGTALFFLPSLPRFEEAKAGLAALLLVAFLALFAVLPALVRGESLAIPFRGPILALLAAMGLSLFVARDLHAGIRTILALGGGALFAGVLAREREGEGAFLTVAIASGLAVALYGLLQRAGIDHPAVLRVYESRRYPVSTFGNTNAATEFVAPCVALSLAALLRGGLSRNLAAATLAVGSLYCGAAGTRAAAIALLAAAAFLTLRERSARSLAVGAATLAGWAVGFLLLRPAAPAEARNDPRAGGGGSAPESFEVRARIYASTLRMFTDHPALGIGAGNFPVAFPPYRDPEEARLSSHGFAVESSLESAHNDPLEIAAETGVPGLLALLGLLLSVGRACFRSSGPAAAGIVAIAANSLLRSPILANPPTLLLLFALLGLVGPARAPSVSPRAGRIGAVLLLPVLWFAAAEGQRGLSAERHLARYFVSEQRDRSALEEAARIDPTDPFLQATLGRDWLEHPPFEFGRARAHLERALAVRPDEPAWRLNLGIALVGLGLDGEAAGEFERVRSLSPLDPRGSLYLGKLAYRKGGDEAAIRWFREARGLRPEAEFLLEAARELAERGDRARAGRYLRARLEDFPQDRSRLEADPLLGPLLPR
jgi:O-antigen ligase